MELRNLFRNKCIQLFELIYIVSMYYQKYLYPDYILITLRKKMHIFSYTHYLTAWK